MEVDFAFLADGAEAVNGKVHVVGGGFDTIWAQQVPVIYPRLSFVLRIMFDAAEIGRKHKLEIQIMDEDGGVITTVGGDLEIPSKSPNLPKGWRQGLLTVLNFAHLTLPKFGDYSFNLVANNTSLKSIPLRVAQHIDLPKLQP